MWQSIFVAWDRFMPAAGMGHRCGSTLRECMESVLHCCQWTRKCVQNGRSSCSSTGQWSDQHVVVVLCVVTDNV